MSFSIIFALVCTHFLVSATPVSMPEECLMQDELSCNDVVQHCDIIQVAERCPHTCGLCPTYSPTVMPPFQPSVSPSLITSFSPTVGPTISPTLYVGCSDGIPDELFCEGKPELCPLFGFGFDTCRYACNKCPTESPSSIPTRLPSLFPTFPTFPTLLRNNSEEQNTINDSASNASSAYIIISSEVLMILSLVFSFLIIV